MRFGMRELVFLLLLLAMPVAAWWYVFNPRNMQIAEDVKVIEQKEQKLRALAQATRQTPNLTDEIDRLSEAIDLFEAQLPSDREVEVLIKEVWELATQRKLTPISIRTDKPVKSGQFSELPIQMKIAGDFDGFYELLMDIEKLPRISRLPRLELEKSKGRDHDKGQMVADMTLSIFFEQPQTEETP